MSTQEHFSEGERLAGLARQVIKESDEKRRLSLAETDASTGEKRLREIRDAWFDGHVAASDLMGLAGLHLRLAELQQLLS